MTTYKNSNSHPPSAPHLLENSSSSDVPRILPYCLQRVNIWTELTNQVHENLEQWNVEDFGYFRVPNVGSNANFQDLLDHFQKIEKIPPQSMEVLVCWEFVRIFLNN